MRYSPLFLAIAMLSPFTAADVAAQETTFFRANPGWLPVGNPGKGSDGHKAYGLTLASRMRRGILGGDAHGITMEESNTPTAEAASDRFVGPNGDIFLLVGGGTIEVRYNTPGYTGSTIDSIAVSYYSLAANVHPNYETNDGDEQFGFAADTGYRSVERTKQTQKIHPIDAFRIPGANDLATLEKLFHYTSARDSDGKFRFKLKGAPVAGFLAQQTGLLAPPQEVAALDSAGVIFGMAGSIN